MKISHIKDPNGKEIKEIIEIEEQAFEGNGNVDLWIIKALIRYGLVFVIKEEDKIISIVEYMQKFNENTVFLYGISTLKSHRFKGYASFLLKESEKYLKNLNYKEIVLTVDPANEIAKNLYLKNGYVNEKLLKDEYGKGIDRYVFKKYIK